MPTTTPSGSRRSRDCEVVIVAATPLRRGVIDAGDAAAPRAPPGRRLPRHGRLSRRWRARGIPLALTPEGTTTGVAEHAVLLVLAVCKRLPYADAELRQGRWHINALRPESRELCRHDGRLSRHGPHRPGPGRASERRSARSGLYFDDAVPLPAERERELGLQRRRFDALLARADLLTLHVPLTPATRHIDRRARRSRR